VKKKICVKLKILPPFTPNLKTIESMLHLEDGPTLAKLLTKASNQGILEINKLIEGDELKDNIVILINGKTIFDLKQELNDGDRVVIMPLAPGG
jgi:molybdopterin converting factor small subunit